MSAQHTPGPWYWDSDPIKGDPLDRVRYRVVATGKTVTQCYYSSGDEQAIHDARLIAAAPELLAALVKLEAMAERYRPAGYPIPDAQKAARAAISLATPTADAAQG